MNTNYPLYSLISSLLICAAPQLVVAAQSGSLQWERDIQAFEAADRANPPPQEAILFIGSSTIRMWKTLAQDFPEYKVLNRGFGGCQIADCTLYADRIVVPYRPRLIVLRAGVNDIAAGKTPEQVRADFQAFVEKVRAKLPKTPIAFMAINATPARWANVAREKKANQLIKDYIVKGDNLDYIDTFDATMGADGRPRGDLFINDRLHFNAAGYKILATSVRGHLPKVPAEKQGKVYNGSLEKTATVSSPASLPATVGGWVNVTNNVGGAKWGAYGVTYMYAVPGSDAVIAGVSECGLWKTTDGGKVWKKLGGGEIKSRPGRIVFDPQNPAVFWVSGCYGDAPFRTDDGGKTFRRLGRLAHADGVAVDFSDPQRKTLLLGLHEQSQSLHISNDGGNTWTRIGDKLPANSNHSSDPIIIDSKTFLVNTAGWKPQATLGIYRSEDAGKSWTPVSTFGPQGPPLLASDGAIYWQRLWGGGLLKSSDQGKSWKAVSTAIKDNPIELPNCAVGGVGRPSASGFRRRRPEMEAAWTACSLQAQWRYLQRKRQMLLRLASLRQHEDGKTVHRPSAGGMSRVLPADAGTRGIKLFTPARIRSNQEEKKA